MSLYDYFTGQQSWKDHVNNRDLIKGFERGLVKANDRLAVKLHRAEHDRAVGQGLGAVIEARRVEVVGAGEEVEFGLERAAQGIDQLRADFNLLMGDVLWKIELQSKELQGISQTLQAPLDTAAKELRNRAELGYRNGWYEEALNDFLESERKNYQDFMVQRSIGSIYLYHLVDLPKALEYFRKAAKYARPRDRRQAAEAMYFAALVCGLQQQIQEGILHLKDATDLNSSFPEAWYMRAGFEATLEDTSNSLLALERAIAGDPRYHDRANFDAMFDRIRPQVQEFLCQLLTTAKNNLRARQREVADWLSDRVVLDAETEQKTRQAIRSAPVDVVPCGTYDECLRLIGELDSTADQLGLYGALFLPDAVCRLGNSTPGMLEFHPNGAFLAASYGGGKVVIWNIDEGQPAHSIVAQQASEECRSVVFDPTGKWLVAACSDGHIRVWEVISGHTVDQFPADCAGDRSTSLCFSADGRLLACCNQRGLTVWDWQSRAEVYSVDTRPPMAFWGSLLATCWGGTIQLWDLARHAEVRSFECVWEASLRREHFVVCPRTNVAARPAFRSGDPSYYRSQRICVWDLTTGRLLHDFWVDMHCGAFSAHPNGTILATGEVCTNTSTSGGRIALWDWRTQREVQPPLLSARDPDYHYAGVYSLAFSPDGTLLAAGTKAGIEVWTAATLPKEKQHRILNLMEKQKEEQRRDQERIASEQEQTARKREAEIVRYRRAAGLCEKCGRKLGFIESLSGTGLCGSCR